jgi:hypothetical protein
MEWIIGFIRVGAIAVIWSLWLCKMTTFLETKMLLSCMLSTGAPVCSFMVAASGYGKSQPLYGGVYTARGHGNYFYYATWVTA